MAYDADTAPRPAVGNPVLKYGLPGLAVGLVVGGILGVAISELGGQRLPPINPGQPSGSIPPAALPPYPDAGPPLEPERGQPAFEAPSEPDAPADAEAAPDEATDG